MAAKTASPNTAPRLRAKRRHHRKNPARVTGAAAVVAGPAPGRVRPSASRDCNSTSRFTATVSASALLSAASAVASGERTLSMAQLPLGSIILGGDVAALAAQLEILREHGALHALEAKHAALQTASEELRHASITDSLTGAYNRRFFMESAVIVR